MVAAVSLTSCSDFLDVEPEGSVTVTEALTNDQQCEDAIDGLYWYLGGAGDDMYGRDMMYEQAGANDIVWGRNRSFNQLALNQFTGDESPLRNDFNNLYELIARANGIILELSQRELSDMSDIEKRSLGEAYFMRGFAHFLVAYRYGTNEQGVPFVAYETVDGGYNYSIPPQSATVMDDYQSVCDDMDKATELLPNFEEYTSDDQGRAHKAAAVAYKAKACAYWATWESSKWSDVITLVNSLESDYGRGLADTYAEIFSSDFSDFWNREYIWSIPGDGGSNGGGTEMVGVMLENKGWGKYNGWGYFKPTEDIYQEFLKDGDQNDRMVRSIRTYGDEITFWGETFKYYSSADLEAGFMINKYMDPFKYANADEAGYVNTNGDYPTARINFPLLRFADCLLLRAEAYLMTGQADKATTDINRLRQRANLASLDHTATTADLYHERRVELAFEMSDHLFDCKRWAVGSDATLKSLAQKELSTDPQVRHYANRTDPESTYTVGAYEGYSGKATFQSYMVVFPYPSDAITESNGQLKQNSGY